MKKLNKFFQLASLVALYSFASLQTVYAEDTEIFFAPEDDVDGVRPNIMFIIDSSGSMGWGVDGTTDNRMEVVQDVMDEVLTNITNVNAGLMRFNNGLGGGILYPVLNIDEEATPTAFQAVTEGVNDAVQLATGDVIDVSSETLEFNGANEFVGVRFENLNIPQGATIVSASVLFTSNADAAGSSHVRITAESVDSAPIIGVTANDMGARNTANGTAASVLWNIEDWVTDGVYATDDISNIVQEVTARPAWCGGNGLMLFFKLQSGSARQAYSKEGVQTVFDIATGNGDDLPNISAPRIKIRYAPTFSMSANKCMTNEAVSQIASQDHDFEIREDGVTIDSTSADLDFYLDGSNAQTGVGMVFQNIKVPQGAVINYAYLSFTADEDSVGVSDVDIEIVDQANIIAPTDYSGLNLAAKTSSVNWSIPDEWVTGNIYKSPDLTAQISQITNKASWALNNSMALFVRGNSGQHTADSFSGDAPKLHIGFRGIWEPGVNTIRDDLKAAVQGLVPHWGTPISSTMAEAGAYFKGDKVFYGLNRGNDEASRFRRVSHPLSYTSNGDVAGRLPGCTEDNLDHQDCVNEVIINEPNYISPIADSCQTNHIVYLTDGESNSHVNTTNAIYSDWSNGGNCSSANGGNDCSVKMAAWLNTNDVSSTLTGKQTVTTHMIGFGPDADPDLMQNMATAGGGGYYAPTDRAELINDISNIVSSIANVNTTFVTSGVTVNQYNRLTHNDQLYFSLFTPKTGITWPGNIKRYKLLDGQIVDANSVPAIDPLNAEFKDDSKSFWSVTTDGNDVELGGAAEQLALGRNVYSNISTDDLSVDGANAVRQSNSAITSTMLGGVTAQRRDTIMYWAEGYDVNHPTYTPGTDPVTTSTPKRSDIGDPLHSQPTVLQYNNNAGDLLTTRIFVGTNHGYLHSFDAVSGSEEWAFIPKDLLSRLDSIIDLAAGDHSYGLDGSVAIHIVDNNGNGAVDPADNDKAYLYIGQRRGGRNYYAVDITEPDAPQMMFTIDGGIRAGYSKLGETWSTPTIGKMNLTGVNSDKLVMIFGGGYDDIQDVEGTASATDTDGKVVYIADAYTGNLLWDSTNNTAAHGGSAGAVSTMNGIPSQVTAFDLDDDELIDHMYVTDTKAQVFRFDIDNTETNINAAIKGGRIAHLTAGDTVSNNQRFYYSADTALIRQVGNSFVSVSIGSGYRAHPLNDQVDDGFYVLRDKGVLTNTFDMDASLSDLQNVSSLVDSNADGISDAVEILNDDANNKKGWYIALTTPGEKVIEQSITFNNAVIFTSYVPPGAAGDVCQAAAGGGRLYAMNILDGNPYIDTNTDGSLTENDRYVDLVGGGIAPRPQVLLEKGSDGVRARLCIGTECGFDNFLPPISDGLMGIKWRKN